MARQHLATALMPSRSVGVGMSDELFHCVCRSCGSERVVQTVGDRGRFFEAHAEHSVVTTTLPTRDEEPEGRVIEHRVGD